MAFIELSLIILSIYIYKLYEKIEKLDNRMYDMNLYYTQKLIFNHNIHQQTLEFLSKNIHHFMNNSTNNQSDEIQNIIQLLSEIS